MPEGYVSTPGLRKLLGNASENTINSWLAQGLLPTPIRMPRTRLWPVKEVVEYLNRRRHQEAA